MTDEQIIKAFEEILKNQNNKLSLIERAVCDDVLSLANRQKAEIEELRSDKIIAETHEKAAKDLFVDCAKQLEEAKAEIKRLQERISYLEESIDCSRKEYNRLLQKLQQAKSEAIKEFAERVKQEICKNTYAGFDKKGKPVNIWKAQTGFKNIDNLVKEMTEVQK